MSKASHVERVINTDANLLQNLQQKVVNHVSACEVITGHMTSCIEKAVNNTHSKPLVEKSALENHHSKPLIKLVKLLKNMATEEGKHMANYKTLSADGINLETIKNITSKTVTANKCFLSDIKSVEDDIKQLVNKEISSSLFEKQNFDEAILDIQESTNALAKLETQIDTVTKSQNNRGGKPNNSQAISVIYYITLNFLFALSAASAKALAAFTFAKS